MRMLNEVHSLLPPNLPRQFDLFRREKMVAACAARLFSSKAIVSLAAGTQRMKKGLIDNGFGAQLNRNGTCRRVPGSLGYQL